MPFLVLGCQPCFTNWTVLGLGEMVGSLLQRPGMESLEVQIEVGKLACDLKGGFLLSEFLVLENQKASMVLVPVGV